MNHTIYDFAVALPMRPWRLAFFILLLPVNVFPETVSETIHKLQKTYETIAILEADFTQTVHFFDFDQKAVSTGKVFLKKGKMRWNYKTPHQQQIAVNGTDVLHYMPENDQVLKGSVGSRTGLPIDLFANLGKMEELFHITRRAQDLILAPKEKGLHVAQMDLTLIPHKSGLLIQKAVLHEENKNRSVFVFSHFRMNKSYRADPFVFDLPPDVEMIDVR